MLTICSFFFNQPEKPEISEADKTSLTSLKQSAQLAREEKEHGEAENERNQAHRTLKAGIRQDAKEYLEHRRWLDGIRYGVKNTTSSPQASQSVPEDDLKSKDQTPDQPKIEHKLSRR